MKPNRFPLGRFVAPRVDEARLARQWANIDERLSGRSRSLRLIPRVAAVVAFALVVLLVSMRGPLAPAPSAVDGVVLETAAGQEQAVTLPEGSRLALEGATRVRLAHVARKDIRLELERGAVRLDVTHVDGRRFVVASREVAVRVVGTKFRVALNTVADGGSVSVSVEEGRVEVTRGAAVAATISAGESWTAPIGVPPVAPAAASVVPSASASAAAIPKKPLVTKRKLGAPFHDAFREGDYAGAFAQVEDDVPSLIKTLDPQDLLELAIAARLSGHPKPAALALDRLRKSFRSDPRAGIAALDLGRLRLDELNDPRGALDALEDAIALPLSAALKEDAEARRVQAFERLGEHAECVAARDDYLLRHPDGVHTTSVARRCKAP